MTETQTRQRKDWRDSLATKIGMFALTGALWLGGGKIVYDTIQENTMQICSDYGFLKGKPIQEQRKYIREDLNKKSWLFRSDFGLRPDVKDWNVDLIIEELKSCKPQSNTK